MALQNISYSLPTDGGYFGLHQQINPSLQPSSLYVGGNEAAGTVGGGGGLLSQPYLRAPPPKIMNDRFARDPYRYQATVSPSSYQQQPQQQSEFQQRSPQYTKIESASVGGGPSNGKTSVHAILDYDDDFGDGGQLVFPEQHEYSHLPNSFNPSSPSLSPTVTPIQGPIFLKNGSVPVVPLFNYPKVNNGTFVQIPIMWAALSLALGYELRGDFVRGSPCIKRNHQLFCPTAGNSYPIERIENFIDDNKALMRRMYGEFESSNVDYGPTPPPAADTEHRQVRTHHHSTFYKEDTYFTAKAYAKRQTSLPKTSINDSGRIDTCESKLEVVTPYWGSNSAGKLRAIVNTQHFEQAIHQEMCSKSETGRCTNECRCEQKYKWHRLLAYDPSNDCKGIFMDWFLYPSCCVCRCAPTNTN